MRCDRRWDEMWREWRERCCVQCGERRSVVERSGSRTDMRSGGGGVCVRACCCRAMLAGS